jgi:DNA-binding beta-propeller fold protein YncE
MSESKKLSISRRILVVLMITALLSPIRLAAQPEVDLTYISQFGTKGSGAGQFQQPTQVDTDSQGRIWVLDEGTSRVQICDYAGNCDFYRNNQGAIATFATPSGLVIDDQDRVLLLSRGNNRLYICSGDTFCQNNIGGSGSGLGQFNSPYGVAINSEGKIVIADTDNRRVQQCDYNGNCTAFGVLAGAQGSPGVWWSPFSVGTNNQGEIFVGEVGSPPGGPPTTGFIHTCNIQGTCTDRWGGFGQQTNDSTAPSAIDTDDRGNVFVADRGNHRIKVCTNHGNCVNFGRQGPGDLRFNFPSGVAFDNENRLIVADQDNERIQILQVTYLDDEPSFNINAGLNDAWYNPITDGQGFLITVFPEIQEMFVAWFTFDTERPPEDVTAMLGEPGHRWLTAQGPYGGDTANLTIFVTEGGVFDAAEPAAATDPAGDGTLTIEFADCANGLVSYEITSLGISGEIPIQRIAPDNIAFCETLGGQ